MHAIWFDWFHVSDHTLHYFEAFLPAMLGVAAVIATAWWTRKVSREAADTERDRGLELYRKEQEDRVAERAEILATTRRQLQLEMQQNRNDLVAWLYQQLFATISGCALSKNLSIDRLKQLKDTQRPVFSFDLWQLRLPDIEDALTEDEQTRAWTFYLSLKRISNMLESLHDDFDTTVASRAIRGHGSSDDVAFQLRGWIDPVLCRPVLEDETVGLRPEELEHFQSPNTS